MVFQKGRCPESEAHPWNVTPAPTRPGLHPQEWGTHLVLHYRGHHSSRKVDANVHNVIEQSKAPGEERRLIKAGEVGRVAKKEQWERGWNMVEHLGVR